MNFTTALMNRAGAPINSCSQAKRAGLLEVLGAKPRPVPLPARKDAQVPFAHFRANCLETIKKSSRALKSHFFSCEVIEEPLEEKQGEQGERPLWQRRQQRASASTSAEETRDWRSGSLLLGIATAPLIT